MHICLRSPWNDHGCFQCPGAATNGTPTQNIFLDGTGSCPSVKTKGPCWYHLCWPTWAIQCYQCELMGTYYFIVCLIYCTWSSQVYKRLHHLNIDSWDPDLETVIGILVYDVSFFCLIEHCVQYSNIQYLRVEMVQKCLVRESLDCSGRIVLCCHPPSELQTWYFYCSK